MLDIKIVDTILCRPWGRKVRILRRSKLKGFLEVIGSRSNTRFKAPPNIVEEVKNLVGTSEAIILSESWNIVKRVPVRDLFDTLQQVDRAYAVVFDGIVTQRIVDVALSKGVKLIVASRIGNIAKFSADITLVTINDYLKNITFRTEECSISLSIMKDHHDVIYESPNISLNERWDIDFEVLEEGVYEINISSSNNNCCYRVRLCLEEIDARTIERLINDIDELLKR